MSNSQSSRTATFGRGTPRPQFLSFKNSPANDQNPSMSPLVKNNFFGTPDSSKGGYEQEGEFQLTKETNDDSPIGGTPEQPLLGKILKDLTGNDGEVSEGSASHTTGLNELEIAKRRNLQLERLKKERNEALDALNRKEAQ